MDENVALHISFKGKAKLALSIPKQKCTTFSSSPIKWLRFLGYAIYGQEGHISLTDGGQPVSDYTSVVEPRSYYFISPDPPRLIDSMGIDGRTSFGTAQTAGRQGFRRRVVERDETCVMSGAHSRYCQAAHIIPHAKTDDYMRNLVSIRAETDNDLDLDSIDDTRNGFLLYSSMHALIGPGHVAFLRTPNFALNVNDVPYGSTGPPENIPASRLTLQVIGNVEDPFFLSTLGNNRDARQPDDVSSWPPALILDFFYGCAALKEWGPKGFKTLVKKHNRGYYSRTAKSKGSSEQAIDRHARYEARQEKRNGKRRRDDQEECDEITMSEAMDLVMGLWMRHAKTTQPEQDIAHIPKDNSRSEMVQAWLTSAR